MAAYIGSPVKRVEDGRFVVGDGRYTDDINVPGQTYACIVRSPHAHARIRSIDASAALARPGVVAVITGKDLLDDGINSLPCGWVIGDDMPEPPNYAIAVDKVRHVGDQVAVVIAEDKYTAQDAAELVVVDYEPLPAVVLGSDALAPGAPLVHDDMDSNRVFDWALGDAEATDAALARAHHVTTMTYRNQRLIPNAIEPRAALGSYDASRDELTLYTTSQNPHLTRLLMCAFVMGLPEQKTRLISPDVGGGFGSKIPHYPEEVICSWAAKKLRRPVKWTATRTEAFMTDRHGRDHETTAEMGFDEEGNVVALRVKTVANLGAYHSTVGPLIPTWFYGTLLAGAYKTPLIHVESTGVFSHTAPVDALRGAGRPEATYVVERLMGKAAHEMGVDPSELRRKNLLPPDAFPYETPVVLTYDSGNYEGALDKALDLAGYADLRAQQAAARDEGRLLGIGFSTYIEACGPAPSKVAGAIGGRAGFYESANVRVHPTGKVQVFTGSHSHGQGHETTFAQIVADRLGIDMGDIEVVHGDTGEIPFGMGTYGSRSLSVGGTAIYKALDKVEAKARKIAAHKLEAAEDDLDFEGGQFKVRGTDRSIGFGDIALTAYIPHDYPDDLEPGLEENAFYDPANFTYPFGTHICLVEVDPDTGKVDVLKYVAVDDVGNVINPLVLHGQIHGGIAHGVGQALLEEAEYDDNGQLLSASYLNYTMPRADDLPSFELDGTVTPCPHNPLGVKGAGETGTIASTPCVVNAVVDALWHRGVRDLQMPLTPERVWTALNAAH